MHDLVWRFGCVFSLVSKRYVHEFFPYAFFVPGFCSVGFFFSVGFFSVGLRGGPRMWLVDSVSLQGSSLEMGLPTGCSVGP